MQATKPPRARSHSKTPRSHAVRYLHDRYAECTGEAAVVSRADPVSAAALNVNVTCLACDGVRPCAQCRALGRSIAAAGHRVFHSSRYAALRAAADGTYGFSACVMPVRDGERHIVDAMVALLPEARVAIAADDAATLAPLPARFVAFSRADYLDGKAPSTWLRSLRAADIEPVAQSAKNDEPPDAARRPAESGPLLRATRRLRALQATQPVAQDDAIALIRDELAWHTASGLGFAVLVVSCAGAGAARLKTALAASLRASDPLSSQGGDCVAVLPGADARHARRAATRAVAEMSKQLGVERGALKVGVAVCPDDGDDAQALLASARNRMPHASG